MSVFTRLLIVAAVAMPLAAQAAEPKVATKDGSKLICHTEQLTGSRFTKKVCMTQADRDAQAERDRANISEQAMKSPLNKEN